MIDPIKAFRGWLLQSTPLTNLVGDFVCCPDLPEKFDAMAGMKALVILVRGGSSQIEVPIIEPSIQIKAWALKGPDARAIYAAAYDQVHGKCMVNLGADGFVLSCYEEQQGQDITDPDTGWATVVASFRLTMRAN